MREGRFDLRSRHPVWAGAAELSAFDRLRARRSFPPRPFFAARECPAARQGLTAMNEHFVTLASAKVMVSNVTPERAGALSAVLEGIPGVDRVEFDAGAEHYRNAAALYDVSFSGQANETGSIEALNAIRQALAGYDVSIDTLIVPGGDPASEQALLQELEAMPEIESAMGLANTEAMDGTMLTDALTPRELAERTGMDNKLIQMLYGAYAVANDQQGRLFGGMEQYRIPLFDLVLFLRDNMKTYHVTLEEAQQREVDELFAQLEGEQPDAERTVRIATREDLLAFAESCRVDSYSSGLTVVLENDVDLAGAPFSGIPIFCGRFEGQGHTIRGLSLTGDGSVRGLFRYLSETSLVRDLTVQGDVAPEGSRARVGGIAGYSAGRLERCAFQGTVSGGDAVGGVVGHNALTGVLEDCTAAGQVGGVHAVGGIAGTQSGYLSDCRNYGAVRGRKEAGGIVGQLEPAAQLEYRADTLQILQGQLAELSALSGRASAHAQNGAFALDGEIAALRDEAGNAEAAVRREQTFPYGAAALGLCLPAAALLALRAKKGRGKSGA